MIELNFLNTAVISGVVGAITAGIVGSFMYAFNESVKSEMFAHVSLAGVGAGILLGFNPIFGAVLVSCALSLVLGGISENSKIGKDALFMLMMNGGLALALVLNHFSNGVGMRFENYLFGSILTLTKIELLSFVSMCVFVCGFCFYNWNKLCTLVFDEEFLEVQDKNKPRVKALFNIVVAVFVAGSLKVIGGLLVSGLLVIAVLASQFVSRGFLQSTVLAIGINILCVALGISVSYFMDIPASAAIILSLIASYGFLGLVARKF